MAWGHRFGESCERLAAERLAGLGWQVLARNYRAGHKEIDLIVRSDQTVAFVEVKGRSSNDFGHPLEAIGRAKRREIERAARRWIACHGRPGDSYRFDAISVLLLPDGTARLEHVENAWRAGE